MFWIEVLRLTKILCFFMVFWLISAAIKASYIQKVENRDTSQIHKLSIQKALELHNSTIFQSRVFEALEFLMLWLDEQLWIHTQTKAVNQRENYFCFHLGSLHITILVSNRKITMKQTMQSHWIIFKWEPFTTKTCGEKKKKKIMKWGGEGYLSLPQPKSLLQSNWFIFKCNLPFFYLFQMYRNKAGTFTNKMKPLTYIITHKLSTTLNGFQKGTCTAVTCKLLESSGTKCCDLHKLQNCTHHMSLLFRCKSIHKDLNKSAWIPWLH